MSTGIYDSTNKQLIPTAGSAPQVTIDANPTQGSTNAVSSGGVYTGLDDKQDKLTFDDAPTQSSNNPVKSGGIYTALAGKQNTLTFDDTPTQNSSNPVKSGGVYTALSGKQNSLTFDDTPTQSSSNPVKSGGVYSALSGKQDTLTFDSTPTQNSNNPVKSGGVYTALSGKQDTLTFDDAPTASSTNPVKSGGVYTALSGKQDTLTFDSTPTQNSTNPVTSGGIYNSLQGLDKNYKGTKAAWDQMTLQEKAQYDTYDFTDDFNGMTVDSAISSTSENPVQNKVIKTALDAKAASSDVGSLSSLTTTDKTSLVAAVNEVNAKAAPVTNFVGTTQAWNALTDAQKATYETVDLTNDFNGSIIDTTVTEGSGNPVSSGAVYTYVDQMITQALSASY